MIIALSGKMKSGKNTVADIIQYLTACKTYENDDSYISDQLQQGFSSSKIYNDVSVWEQKAFAYKVKQIASILTGIPVEDFEKQEVKDQILGEQWWYYNGYQFNANRKIPYNHTESFIADEFLVQPTYRQLLQHIGTEAIRNQIHENAWVNALFSEYVGECHVNYSIRNGGSAYSYMECACDTEDGCEEEYKHYPSWIITDMRFPNELQAVKDRKSITIRINRPTKNNQTVILSKSQEHPSETALDNISDWDYVIDNNGTIPELIQKVKEILIKENII